MRGTPQALSCLWKRTRPPTHEGDKLVWISSDSSSRKKPLTSLHASASVHCRLSCGNTPAITLISFFFLAELSFYLLLWNVQPVHQQLSVTVIVFLNWGQTLAHRGWGCGAFSHPTIDAHPLRDLQPIRWLQPLCTCCALQPLNGPTASASQIDRRMERTKKSACRSLFGPVDHEQLRRDLQQELREMTERDSQRWNFDFQAGTPLPGGFQWEDTPADRAPALYRDSLTCPSGGEKSADTNQENCFNISNKCAEEKTPVQRRRKRRPLSKPGAKRKADARITGKTHTVPHFRQNNCGENVILNPVFACFGGQIFSRRGRKQKQRASWDHSNHLPRKQFNAGQWDKYEWTLLMNCFMNYLMKYCCTHFCFYYLIFISFSVF